MNSYEYLKFDSHEIITKKYSFLVKKYQMIGTNILLEKYINNDLEKIYLCVFNKNDLSELVFLLKKLIENTEKKNKFHPIKDQAKEILTVLSQNISIRSIDDLLSVLSLSIEKGDFIKSSNIVNLDNTAINNIEILNEYFLFLDNNENSDSLSKVDLRVIKGFKSISNSWNKKNFHNFRINIKELYEYLQRGNESRYDVSKIYEIYNFIEEDRISNFILLEEKIVSLKKISLKSKNYFGEKNEELGEYIFNDRAIFKEVYSFFKTPYYLKNADTLLKNNINESLKLICEKYMKKDFISFYKELQNLRILLEPIEDLKKILYNVDTIISTIKANQIGKIDYLMSICNSKKYVYPSTKNENNSLISNTNEVVIIKQENVEAKRDLDEITSVDSLIELLYNLKKEYEVQFQNFSEDVIRERERQALLIGLSGMALINYGKVGGSKLSLSMGKIMDYNFLISLRTDIIREESLEDIENKLKMKLTQDNCSE